MVPHRYRLVRKAAEPLAFEGREIARATSWTTGKDRWSEVVLYARTDGVDGWVLRTVGRTAVEGEHERFDAVACPNPEDVVRALLKSDSSTGVRRYYLPDLAVELIDKACEADPNLAEVIGIGRSPRGARTGQRT